jgi:acyl-coenzyme A thioesterase PaaI-like protein
VCPRFDFRNWRSNLSKCEAVNNGDTASNATFFFTTAAAIYNEEGKNEESNATDRIDYYYKKMNPNDVDRTSLMDSHAIFGALRGKDLIERYHVYQRVNMNTEHQLTIIPSSRELAVVDLKVGKKLNGHRGITHGGIISLLFDEAMGWAYECLQQQDHIDSSGMMIVTANLTVDFRAPLLEGSEAVIRVYHNETKGRKIYFSAKLESKDGNVLFAEATSLFILARSDKLRTKER